VSTDDTLTLAPDCLLVFIDDTGHEALSGDHSYYRLGGVALLKDHYDHVINPAWLEVRRVINGSPAAPLHGSTFGQRAKAEDFEVLRTFFQGHQFPRFAASVSRSTVLPTDLDAMIAVAETIRTHTENLVTAIDCSSAAIIIESSQRADPQLRERFVRLDVQRNGSDIPVEYCFMPKSSNEPGLEIADFVASAAGSLARRRFLEREGFPPDFQDVFMRDVPKKLAYFRTIDRIVGRRPDQVVHGYQLW
jgi:hypothetical protein